MLLLTIVDKRMSKLLLEALNIPINAYFVNMYDIWNKCLISLHWFPLGIVQHWPRNLKHFTHCIQLYFWHVYKKTLRLTYIREINLRDSGRLAKCTNCAICEWLIRRCHEFKFQLRISPWPIVQFLLSLEIPQMTISIRCRTIRPHLPCSIINFPPVQRTVWNLKERKKRNNTPWKGYKQSHFKAWVEKSTISAKLAFKWNKKEEFIYVYKLAQLHCKISIPTWNFKHLSKWFFILS